jgi:hypothetical protein
VIAAWSSYVRWYGVRVYLDLPAIRSLLAKQAGLEKDFAERVQGFGNAIVDPGPTTAQHLRNFFPRKSIEADQGNHFGMGFAEASKTKLDITNEKGLVLEAGNGVMRPSGAEKFSSQQRGQPSHLGRDLIEMPNDGHGLPAVAENFRTGIEFVALLDRLVRFEEGKLW